MTHRHRGEAEREREDTAICGTKPDWPEAASGPVVTRQQREAWGRKGEERGRNVAETRLAVALCNCLSLMIVLALRVETKR